MNPSKGYIKWYTDIEKKLIAAIKDYSEAELKELAKDEADDNIGKATILK